MVDLAGTSNNQRPGFQLTYVSKTLAHDPTLKVIEKKTDLKWDAIIDASNNEIK